MPVLRYKQTDSEGRPANLLHVLQPEPPPVGITTALEGLNADLMAVVGIYDPSQLPKGNQSGKAIQGQQPSRHDQFPLLRQPYSFYSSNWAHHS